MNTIDLEVQGMSCGSCVNHVTQALKPINGVDDVAHAGKWADRRTSRSVT